MPIVISEECHATIEEVQDTSDTLVVEDVSAIEEKLVNDDSVTLLQEEGAGIGVDEVISLLGEDEEAAPIYGEFDGEGVPSY